jgi:hypothetical protein
VGQFEFELLAGVGRNRPDGFPDSWREKLTLNDPRAIPADGMDQLLRNELRKEQSLAVSKL